MWICSEHGFYSIVSDNNNPGHLLVRARDEKHLRSLLEGRSDPPVLHTPDSDYPYRVSLPRDVVLDLVAGAIRAIDYPNFKARVDYHARLSTQDSWYSRALHKMWGVMWSAAQHRR